MMNVKSILIHRGYIDKVIGIDLMYITGAMLTLYITIETLTLYITIETLTLNVRHVEITYMTPPFTLFCFLF
jgi:hypothetical protein